MSQALLVYVREYTSPRPANLRMGPPLQATMRHARGTGPISTVRSAQGRMGATMPAHIPKNTTPWCPVTELTKHH
jgi:hypothetical protein